MGLRGEQGGFTLIELVISMVLLSLISLAIYGLTTIGAQAAGSGERRTEQTRRMRIATSLITRQLRSAAPLHLPHSSTKGRLGRPSQPPPFRLRRGRPARGHGRPMPMHVPLRLSEPLSLCLSVATPRRVPTPPAAPADR